MRGWTRQNETVDDDADADGTQTRTTMTSYHINLKAYSKIAFHAAKYPSRAVNGVLLGKCSTEFVEIEDSVPLLHHWTSLSPTMEIGLSLVG